MHLFYCPAIFDNQLELPEEEAYHAINVLRLKSNDTIQITDGLGHLFNATITEINKRKCFAKIDTEIPQSIRNSKLHIAIAPTKNIDRFEWFLEKATEVGIEEITPILCRFSERKEVKNERLNKLIVAAAKQSKHSLFPKLNPMISFKDFIGNMKDNNSLKMIAHCEDLKKNSMNEVMQNQKSCIVLIGPEGDFSNEEIENANANFYIPITLGDFRLRTETAGLVACISFNLFLINNK